MRKRRKHLYRREDCKQNPVPPPKPLRSSRKDDRIWVMTKCKSATESAESASKKAGRRNGLQQKLKFQCSSFAHWKRTAQSGSRPLGTPVGCNGSQQRFSDQRLFWKQHIGLQDAGWSQEKIAAVKVNRRKWAVLSPKSWVLVLYSDKIACYNIAMAQVSVAQEGKLPEMH